MEKYACDGICINCKNRQTRIYEQYTGIYCGIFKEFVKDCIVSCGSFIKRIKKG